MSQKTLFDCGRAESPVKTLPFADWVLRPDVDGRLGWEAPNLPERVRWWARFRFEELPTGDGNGDESPQETGGPDCQV
jgi:hypothetical protein